MTPKLWTRRGMSFLLVLSALVFPALSVRGYVPLRWGANGAHGFWRSDRFPLSFFLNESSAAGTQNLSPGSNPQAAVRAAAYVWQSVQTAEIRFAAVKLTPLDSARADGTNLITMADNAINKEILGGAQGAVALTRLDFNPATGEITESDIILNPDCLFSTTLDPDTYDLQAVLTHELGHVLGSDHSPAQNDTMFALFGPGEFFQRYLSADAIAFASFTYPSQARIASLGTITGYITSGSKGVFGASVTAVNLDGNQTYNAFSERDGSFSINGPAAGRYMVFAEPLDGPATPEQLLVQGAEAYYQGLNNRFRTSFAGEIKLGIDGFSRKVKTNISVPSGFPDLNIERMGRGDPDTGVGYLSEGAVIVSPGETLSLWIGGENTWKLARLEDLTVLGPGISLDPERGIRVLKNSTGAQAGISVLAHIAADAAPGPRTILLKAGDEQVASTGGIVVAARSLPATKLYFPYFKALPDTYTGIALANLSDLPATARISGRDPQGALLWSQDATVPADISIANGAQSARLDRQIFNLSPAGAFAGSVTVESESPDLQGFFSTGNHHLSFLDGAEAFSRGFKQLHFVDVIQNAQTSCEIHLMNITDIPISVDLVLADRNATSLRTIRRTIPAWGKIGETVSDLFGYSGALTSAHVTATAAEDALAGCEIIRQPNAAAGLNAIPTERGGSVLYDPQLAVGDLGLHFDTRLNLVNVGAATAMATITLVDESGKPMQAGSKTVTLVAGAQYSLDVHKVFGIELAQGYIKVVSSGEGRLAGNVIFGDGDPAEANLNFAAALPLFESGARDLVFSHVAQAAGYYTGLAVLLPGEARANAKVTLEAFDAAGESKGASSFELRPGQREVLLLGMLLPETNGQTGGYVRVMSDQPVVGFEIFGNGDGHLLTAVPPQRFLR